MISDTAKEKLLKYPNVVAVGTANRTVDGTETGETAIVAFVSSKKDVTEIEDTGVLPETVEGVKVDVQEIDLVSKEVNEPEKVQIEEQSGTDEDPTEKRRPYPQGFSLGHQDGTAGTAGGIRWVEATKEINGTEFTYPKPVQVSNNHVLTNENQVEEGDSILQPGPYDGGKNIDEDYRVNGDGINFIRISFDDDVANLQDTAWHEFYEPRQAVSYNPQSGVAKETYEVSRGEQVFKGRTRTTPYRQGKVLSTDALVKVKYGSGVAKFKDQIITESISRPGDSGSQIFIRKNGETMYVGRLFAGSPRVSIITPAETILNNTPLHLNPEDVYTENGGE